MTHVQANIHFLVDYHNDGGTKKLAVLPPAAREAFLKRCVRKLHGDWLPDFVELCQSPVFRPLLPLEGTTRQPSFHTIWQALEVAVVTYNEEDYGMKFEIVDKPHADHATTAMAVTVPDYACVQWVWVNGEWVKRYNYDLAIVSGAPAPEGDLMPAYRVALTYSY